MFLSFYRCQEDFQMRTSQTYMRSRMLEVERGTCQHCGLGAHDLFLKVRDAPPSQRKEMLENTWLAQLSLKEVRSIFGLLSLRVRCPRWFHHAEHANTTQRLNVAPSDWCKWDSRWKAQINQPVFLSSHPPIHIYAHTHTCVPAHRLICALGGQLPVNGLLNALIFFFCPLPVPGLDQ